MKNINELNGAGWLLLSDRERAELKKETGHGCRKAEAVASRDVTRAAA